jgi:hypothetical protein
MAYRAGGMTMTALARLSGLSVNHVSGPLRFAPPATHETRYCGARRPA